MLQNPDTQEEVPEDFTPVVIAESTSPVRTMTVGDAVMALDMTDAPVVVFRNAGDDGINVVYKRKDGHVGWVNPSLTKE